MLFIKFSEASSSHMGNIFLRRECTPHNDMVQQKKEDQHHREQKTFCPGLKKILKKFDGVREWAKKMKDWSCFGGLEAYFLVRERACPLVNHVTTLGPLMTKKMFHVRHCQEWQKFGFQVAAQGGFKFEQSSREKSNFMTVWSSLQNS